MGPATGVGCGDDLRAVSTDREPADKVMAGGSLVNVFTAAGTLPSSQAAQPPAALMSSPWRGPTPRSSTLAAI
jgi:hypothetical protein